MIEFPNFKNVSGVNPSGSGRQVYPSKKEETIASAGKGVGADVLQISPDAALRSKASAFAAALAKEMDADAAERIAQLKEQYSGDACPRNGDEIAAAIFAKANMEGYGDE
jgi:hypothetical protein